MIVLGITGGAASGKSVVTRMFADLGAPTLSADAVAHELMGPGTEVSRAVRAAFGLPGADADPIDRAALRAIVFEDPAARQRLEAITHPAILAALRAQMTDWRAQPGVCAAAEIPLLFEAGMERDVDRIVVVACDPPTQQARLRERLGDAALAERIMAAQWPLEDRIARAHHVIRTDGSLDEVRRQVTALRDSLRPV